MMKMSRLEAFSDGVFAIAITLLILEIRVPEEAAGHLGRELARLWPSYATYAISFLTIGIIWVNHHQMFDRVAKTDRTLLFLNLFLLMTVAFIPFPTALLARFLRGGDQAVAAVFYALSMLAMAIAFFTTLVYITRKRALLDADILPDRVKAVVRRNAVGLGMYSAAIAAAGVNAKISLALCGANALYFIHPGRAAMEDLRERAGSTGA